MPAATRRELLVGLAAAPLVAGAATPRRADLAAAPVSPDRVVTLVEAGRRGNFVWTEGDFSRQVAADGPQGLYIASAIVAPRLGCWVRDWDGIHGRPEWFGAQAGDPSFDNVPALDACVALCPVIVLAAADYHVHRSWIVVTSNRRIVGMPGAYDAPGDSTRILRGGLGAGSGAILRVGLASEPPALAGHAVHEVHVSGLVLQRLAPCDPPASGRAEDAATGLAVQYVLGCRFDQVKCIENSVGVRIIGAVNTDLSDIQTTRTRAGSAAAHDVHIGYLVGGPAAVFGFAGANASLRLTRCIANGSHPQFVAPAGLLLYGYAVDTFVSDFETSGIPRGIVVDGRKVAASPAHADIRIHRATLDGIAQVGLELTDLNEHAAVEIIDTYVGLAPGSTALRLGNCRGGVSITGGQLLGFGERSGMHGLDVAATSGLTVTGLKIIGLGTPLILENTSHFDIQALITNPGERSGGPACRLAGCSRGRMAPIVKGSPGMFTTGVALAGKGNNYMEVNCTGIDPGCLVPGAPKLSNDGVSVTTGAFGNANIASGVLS